MAYRKAFRFQIRPRSGREGQLRRYAGMCRRVWNDALAEQKARHTRGEKYAGYLEMARWLTAWRHAPSTAWLSEGPDPQQFALDRANLKLPKLGWLRLRMSRPVDGALRNVTLRREGEKWFASLQVEMGDTVPSLDVPPTLGIDRGLSSFAATSAEALVSALQALAKQQRRLRHLQRAVSRKRKGSSKRRKAVRRLGSWHRRIARKRADWLHKLSTELTEQHTVIAIEALRIKNMSASALGACRLYEPHVPAVRVRVGRESQDSVALSVRGLRSRGACGHSRCEERFDRGARGLGEAARRSARSPWRGGKTGEHSRSFCEVGTRRSKGVGMSHAHAHPRAVGILGLLAAEDVNSFA